MWGDGMLTIVVPELELFNESDSSIIRIPETELVLEHSLIALSKWEEKYHVPFLDKREKTAEQVIDYIRFMTVSPKKVDPNVYTFLGAENIRKINTYIEDPHTASVVKDSKSSGNGQFVTSELIYCWMIQLNIPVCFEKWHLNRLLMLIKVCNAENSPKKKMSTNEILRNNAALNEARKKALGTKG